MKGGKIIKRRKVDYELVKKEFDERGYILLSKEYIKNSCQLEYLCPKHLDRGVQYITFGNFTAGKGCPYCGGTKRKTHEEYVQQLKEKKPNIRVIGKYKSLKTKIEHECLICEYRWFALPDNLLNLKNGCPRCGKRLKLTNEEFVKRVKDIFIDSIVPLEEYKGHDEKISFLCKECNLTWYAKANNILNKKGCPNCKRSKGELKISNILDKNNVNYIQQYKDERCKNIYCLPFDFYLPEYNIFIEYDGIQHFESCTFGGIFREEAQEKFKSCIERDKIKTKFCKENNINLVRIPYFDYDKIEDIIVSIIH